MWYWSPQKGKNMKKQKQSPRHDPPIVFTAREKDVLRLLASYQTNEEMCRELCIGKETLMTHFKNIKRKTRIPAARKIYLIKYAVENGFGKRRLAV
jgi:DNA-binding NarL/FixJ family response regulator